MNMAAGIAASSGRTRQYVTIRLGGQLFGLPIERAQDVFIPDNFSPVPLARREISGVLNLRGRILTAIDLSRVLDVPAVNQNNAERPVVCVVGANESYGFLTDSVGEVIALDADQIEANPVNMDPGWARVSAGTCRLETELLVILNVDALIESMVCNETAELRHEMEQSR